MTAPPLTARGAPRRRAAATATFIRRRLIVEGIVQGVGFRPFVWRLAQRLRLGGFARNGAAGVEIEIEGRPDAVLAFRRRLAKCGAPAMVQRVRERRIAPRGTRRFAILDSIAGRARTDLPPDLATCAECRREIFDPHDRRHRYPFTTCTNCGPRFTVAATVPYDRATTTLRGFALCRDCAREYGDPSNRRFRAESIACPQCGPRLWLEAGSAGCAPPADGDPIAAAAAILRCGGVIGVLGVGGFHLACDATDARAVARIRAIKHRPAKPLAVMVDSAAAAAELGEPTAAEHALLASPTAPIVLVQARAESRLAANVAPGVDRVGLLLPYTPLHHLLLRDAGRPLVMTSANGPGEPIACTADEARAVSGSAIDALLVHDRPIHQRCDDGVWMVTPVGPQPLRRSRGTAPMRIAVPVRPARPVLGVGGDFKNTFCLLDHRGAVLSQYIGAMEQVATQAHFRATLAKLEQSIGATAGIAACDGHPGYASRRFAAQLGLAIVTVQHHHAHVAACLAEHGRTGPAIGVAFDGTGYGNDGAIWGGEVLIADLGRFERVGHLEYLPLPGGDAAIRHPARIAAAYLLALCGDLRDARLHDHLGASTVAVLRQMITRRRQTVDTSSCGRLFDAVAALLGVADEVTYEGQAAVQLEALASSASGSRRQRQPYPFETAHGIVGLRPLMAALLTDRAHGIPAAAIARRFHATVAHIVLALARHARASSGLGTVALSGGCFQNRLLLGDCLALLADDRFEVLTHAQVPPNDGGLALGQACVAAARLEGGIPCA